ncbi:MAG: ABC transporter permease [Rhodanobacteraceae bacterium]
MLVLELALTCAIVCNAVFLIQQRLQRMDLPSGIAENQLVQIQLGYIGKARDAKAQAEADLAALRQIPGVKQVGIVDHLPFSNGGSSNGGIKLRPHQQHDTAEVAEYFGQNLFSTLGLRRVAGRQFGPDECVNFGAAVAALQTDDIKNIPQTLIMTRALAERLWPGESALGKTVYFGNDLQFRIIGVVADLARPNQLQEGAGLSVLFPIHMTSADGGSYVIRTAPQDRQRVLKAALVNLKQLGPNRVVPRARTDQQARHQFFASDRAMAGMLVGVIVVLLLVTGLGIVALASFWVAQRRKQIGIRRALGARRIDILRYFQTENFLIVTFGIVLGMVLAYGLSLLLMQHYELPRLPWFYLPIGAVALWVIGRLAVLGSALRAAAVPPVGATRSG